MSYALFAVYEHPRETWAQQKQFLFERIIPMCKAQPGFVSGSWCYAAKDSRTFGQIVFDTEANARQLETFMREEAKRPNPFGVTPISIDVTEVIGEARGA